MAVSSLPRQTVELHHEFSADDEHETYANVNSEAIISNEQTRSSCDSVVTIPTLGQDLPSCLHEREMSMKCKSKTAKTSKLSTANPDAKVCVFYNSKRPKKICSYSC